MTPKELERIKALCGMPTDAPSIRNLTNLEAIEEAITALPRCVAEIERLGVDKLRFEQMEDLLRSAHAIAARKGAGVAWERFAASIAKLGIGSVTARTYRVLESDQADPPKEGADE